ncbi:MAG: M56 family metallopeptidase [Pirellulales bacterium]
MFNRLLAVDAAWDWLALEIVVKSTLLLLLGAGVAMLLCRSSAAVRHRVWALSFAGLLLLPAVQLLMPDLSWRIIPHHWLTAPIEVAAAHDQENSAPPATVTSFVMEPIDPTVAAAEGEAVRLSAIHDAESVAFRSAKVANFRGAKGDEASAAPKPAVHREDDDAFAALSAAWLSRLWLLGASIALIPLIIGLLENLRLRFHGRRLANPNWQCLLAALSHRLELRRSVTLLFGGPQQMPMTFGLLRPCVILPSSAEHWSAERRQIVLLHELAHVKRCDVPLQLIARLGAAVYWFHPLVWWALRQMRQEREHACDDCVLQAGQEAPDYATQLLEIARTHRSRTPLLNAALSMARPSQLEGRLLAVLDLHRRRNGISRGVAIQLTAIALVLVACVGLVRPTLQAEATALANDNEASAATDDPSKPATQMVLTGTVLSPHGKPVPAATVEVIGYDESHWRRGPRENTIDHYQTQADAKGKFRLIVPRDVSRPRQYTKLFASADGFAPFMQTIHSTGRKHVEVKLHEPKVVRLQLIDMAGNPFADVQPRLWDAFGDGVELFIFHRNGPQAAAGWPKFSPSDAQGFVSTTLPASTKKLVLLVEDERLGDHLVRVELSDQATGVVLKPARFLSGKITAADTGEPVAGAEVVMMKMPYRGVRTGADGSFRIASGATIDAPYPGGRNRHIIYVYPPRESPYLARRSEWQGHDDALGDGELSVLLARGIVVQGRLIEKRSREPIAGATVVFEPQRENNPLFQETASSGQAVFDMRYTTDADGRFRMPVWPGPGYLLVRGPTLDYLHMEITTGDKYYGKPGNDRQYHHGALRLNLEPNEPPQPLTIELERGVTLRRRVLRPDGQPAVGKAYARSYLLHYDAIHGTWPPIPIEEGLLEIPGFEPERSKPIVIVDPQARCAAVVAPAASEIDVSSPPIKLQPCGAASFRFVTDKGTVLSNHEPTLRLIVTPGATATWTRRSDQAPWADSIIWQNIARPAKIPKTDADGRVTIDNLIPGATYRVSFVDPPGDFAEGYEFIVRSGETVDVGEVVIPEPDE